MGAANLDAGVSPARPSRIYLPPTLNSSLLVSPFYSRSCIFVSHVSFRTKTIFHHGVAGNHHSPFSSFLHLFFTFSTSGPHTPHSADLMSDIDPAKVARKAMCSCLLHASEEQKNQTQCFLSTFLLLSTGLPPRMHAMHLLLAEVVAVFPTVPRDPTRDS